MKGFIQGIKSNVKGSVSLFFVIITAIVFMFNAVLIDYARILAAEQQTEYAIQSATRSAMAAFDSKLKDDYGLFGVDEGSISFFEDLLKESLELENLDSDVFRFIDLEVTSSNADFDKSRTLADPAILKHQILEEMKYKAPVEITKEIIEKFTFVSKAMKETSTFIEVASEINEYFEDREALLDEIDELLKDSLKNMTALEKEFTTKTKNKLPKVEKFTDIEKHYQDYKKAITFVKDNEAELIVLQASIDLILKSVEFDEKKVKKEKDRIKKIKEKLEKLEEEESTEKIEEEIKELKEELEELEENEEKRAEKLLLEDTMKEIAAKVSNKLTEIDEFEDQATNKTKALIELRDKTDENLEQIIEKIDEAKELNEEMKRIIDEDTSDKDALYGGAISKSEGAPVGSDGNALDDAMDSISQNTADLKNYVYDSKIFDEVKNSLTDFEEPLKIISENLKKAKDAFADAEPTKLENLGNEGFYIDLLKTNSTNVKTKVENAIKGFDKFIKHREKHFGDLKTDAEKAAQKEKEKENKKNAKDENKRAEKQIKDAKKMADAIAGDFQAYGELAVILEGVKEHFEDMNIEASDEMEYGSKAEDSAKSAMKLIDNLFNGIGNMLIYSRDELYVNEYVLSRFESKKPSGIANPDDYLFKNREVEYILYGLEGPGLNYSAALAQLSAIRFAMNFISAFTDPKVRAAGHPLAIFIAALGYALKYTVDDMGKISSGENAPLLRFTPQLQFAYKDYLRLFLFMNPAGDTRLMRVASVIEQKGIDLKKRQTYIHGTVETSVELWFIPEIAKGLNKVGILDGRVEGNKFIFNKKADFTY